MALICCRYIFIIFVTLVIVTPNYAAKILAVFPVPSISHQVVFRSLTHELVRRGHDVVVVTPDPAFPKGESPENLIEIDVHNESYKLWRDTITDSPAKDLTTQLKYFFSINLELFQMHMENKEVRHLIDSKETFDLILVEACSRPALAYSHIFKAPVILISSFGSIPGNFESVGAPVHPILYANVLRQRTSNLNLWEKFVEFCKYYLYKYVLYLSEVHEDLALREMFGMNAPTIDELQNNVHMLFLNVNPVFEGARPVPPAVVYMGGIHQKPEKELPMDLKNYLDSSKNGVIYISFGTNVNSEFLPPEKIQVLVKVVSKLSYDVLWKWDSDDLPGRSDNIRISKWFPQSDLLGHPKIKLFVTQGGLQSTDEALAAGVPLIGMPLLGDQWFNVEKYVDHKIGVRVDLETVTEEQFMNAITTVIGNESYRQNVIKLHTLMHDQPQSPLDRAIWWIEHTLRHGGAKHLRAPGANITWTEYLELELVFTVLLVLAVFLILVVSLSCFVFRKCFRSIKKTKTS